MANPAPTAESAGIQTLPSAACAAVGVINVAALMAAVGMAAVTGISTRDAFAGARMNARLTAPISKIPATKTETVMIKERGAAILTSWKQEQGEFETRPKLEPRS